MLKYVATRNVRVWKHTHSLGFTVPEIDKVLEPYAIKSYEKYVQELSDIYYSITKDTNIDDTKIPLYIHEKAFEKVRTDFLNGWQGLEYKLNSVGSSRGDYPFTTVTFGIYDTIFGKLASETVMETRKNGQGKKGHKRPCLFPKLVFLYDKELHGEGKTLEYLFDKAIDCSSVALYPDYLSLTGDGYVPSMYKKYKKAISPINKPVA